MPENCLCSLRVVGLRFSSGLMDSVLLSLWVVSSPAYRLDEGGWSLMVVVCIVLLVMVLQRGEEIFLTKIFSDFRLMVLVWFWATGVVVCYCDGNMDRCMMQITRVDCGGNGRG